MRILIGLGNPGKEYQETRHNVGQLFLDFLARKWQLGWEARKDLSALVVKKGKFFLAKPLIFMNESGRGVKKILAGLGKGDLILIHDELDLALGKWKLTFAKSSPLHKGVLSVERYLKTKNFWRLRLGIDNRLSKDRVSGEDYVLQKFTPTEKGILKEVFKELLNYIEKNELAKIGAKNLN